VSTLREYAGEDPFRLSIRQLDGEELELHIDDLTGARKCPELTNLLGDIIGP
jgi:hypothetical protein